LKEAVYEVDDVVDEFQLKAEKYEADGDGWIYVQMPAHKTKITYISMPGC
jgi:hypothetical protein